MKRNITTVLLVIVAASFSLLSHHNGVAEEQNKDRTGAPGSEQPCTHCHSPSSSFNVSSEVLVIDGNGNEVSEYIPELDYEIEFRVSAAGAAAYGFQATSVLANGSNAGEFTNPGTNVQLEQVGSRHIVEQSTQHVSGVFTTSWTAPATGSGDVAFYMAGLAVNMANGNNGDSHHATALSLTEGVNDGVDQTSHDIVNQPIVNALGIQWNAHTSGEFYVYDINGKLHYTSPVYEGTLLEINKNMIGNGLQILEFIPSDLENYTSKSWKIIVVD